jgi:ribosomal protein RSM22 (predicted rRNA methylase)
VERTGLHRQLKDGLLSYEDEKFSYVVLAKQASDRVQGRIVGRPSHSPGLIQLPVCTGGRIEQLRITKRDKDAFRRARKSEWGDGWLATETDPSPGA